MRLPFEWVGGSLALDFCNTVSWGRDGILSEERLEGPGDLEAWAAESRRSAETALPRGTTASRRPAPRDIRQARAVRSCLHALLSALADGRKPGPRTLREFNRWLGRALSCFRVSPGGDGLRWTARRAGWNPLLSSVIRDASQLATSGDAASIRRCANPDCGWLFVDRSRRHNRRWCEMAVCGSRAKARRYHARRRIGRLLERP